MGGPTHTKGVLILSGYLNGRYAQKEPLSLTARLVFEQSYSGVDGDSASSTELYALLSALSDKPIKIKELAKKIGAKSPSFGKPDLLMEALGVIPGAVTPFAAVNIKAHGVTIILDEEMMGNELLNFHPLVNTATTSIAPRDLVKFLEHCHKPPEVILL